MEIISSPFFFRSFEKMSEEFFIQSEQDGLFFGLDCLKKVLESEDTSNAFEVTSYLQEGECVFQGQTLMKINLKDKKLEKESFMSILSYLSGAYTLVSCFTERNFDFSIMACSTPDFILFEWEEKAILKAGGLIQKCPETICCHSDHDVNQFLEKGEKQIILNGLKMSKEEIKNTLQSLPPSIESSLFGAFLPYDLEEFRFFQLKSIYPICLQGCFPRLKMKLYEDSYTDPEH